MAGRFRQLFGGTVRAVGWSGAASALAAIAVGVAAHFWLDHRLSGVKDQATQVRNETVKVEREIAEVVTLREKISAVLARRQVVDALGAGRNWPVRLLDQLPRLRPDGVELVSVTQRGALLDLAGNAASHEAVVELLRRLAASTDFHDARLAEVRTDAEARSGHPVRFVAVVGVRAQARGRSEAAKGGK